MVPLLAAWADALRLAPDPPGRSVRALAAAHGAPRRRRRRLPRRAGPRRAARRSGRRVPRTLHGALVRASARSARIGALPAAVGVRSESGARLRARARDVVLGRRLALRRSPRSPPCSPPCCRAARSASRAASSPSGSAGSPLAMLLNANLLPLEAPFAERYVFVSSLGVTALVAAAGDRLAARTGAAAPSTVAGVVALVVLAALTIYRSALYRDEIAFTRQWVATSPRHANAQASLGAALARAGRDDEAAAALREAVRLEPALAVGALQPRRRARAARRPRRGDRRASAGALEAWPVDPTRATRSAYCSRSAETPRSGLAAARGARAATRMAGGRSGARDGSRRQPDRDGDVRRSARGRSGRPCARSAGVEIARAPPRTPDRAAAPRAARAPPRRQRPAPRERDAEIHVRSGEDAALRARPRGDARSPRRDDPRAPSNAPSAECASGMAGIVAQRLLRDARAPRLRGRAARARHRGWSGRSGESGAPRSAASKCATASS